MREKLFQLLSLSKVKKIIYVDDLFCLDHHLDKAKAILNTWLETGEYKKLDFLPEDKEIALEEFESWWMSATDEDKRKCIFEIMEVKIDEQSILDCLKEIKEKGIDVIFMEPSDFSDEYIARLKSEVNKDSQVLLLMDKEFEGQQHGGEALLKKIDDTQFVHCGLFSGTFAIEDEIKEWKNRGFSATVYPLSKNRILEEPEEKIIEGLRNILWLNHISKMKKDAIEVFKKSVNNACDRFKNIDPASFDSAIIRTSQKEGCWEYLTLNRILMVMLENSIHSEVAEENKFSKIQEDLSLLRESSFFCSEEYDKTWLKELRNSELYTSGAYINKTYSPVVNGDIFLIGAKKYILLFQPCSLSIREHGNRARDLSSAYVIEIKTFTNDKQIEVNNNSNDQQTEIKPNTNDKSTLKDIEVPLENPKDLEFHYVSLASFQHICLDVVDMVSFNSEGKAIIDVSKKECPIDEKKLLQPNMLKRYKKLVNFVKRLIPILKTYDKGDAKDSAKYFLKSCFLTLPMLNGDNVVEFPITRVERYNELLSQVLYSKLMNYMSRIAVPNDFSE